MYVLRKDEGDWMRGLAYEVEGIRPRGVEVDLRRLEQKLLIMTQSVCIYVHLIH